MKSLKRVVAICPFVLFFALLWIRQAPLASAAAAPYTQVTILASQGSWGNNLADLDGDGFLDIIEGGGDLGGNVYWFQYPSWQRFQIGTDGGGDDLQVADINRDGALDVVVNGTGKIVWYQNPRGTGGDVQGLWTKHTVDATLQSHDIDLVDLDGDGRLDIVIRVEESKTYYYLQGATADTWTRVLIPQSPDGHGGLAAGDINRDGRIDIAENGFWLEAPANLVSGAWIKHDVSTWTAGSSAALYDINHDGRLDLFLAVSEAGPGSLAWFEAPLDPIAGVWIRHDIDAVEDVHRFFLVDMNKDGTEDLVFAEMHQSVTKRVGVYYNGGLGASWTLQVLSTQGSHNIAVGDIGNDGDNDIIGANWSTGAPDGGAQNMWRNDLNNALSLDTWTYSQVDGAKQDVAFGLTFGDLDGDGRKDIISGEYWYRNPGGNLTGPWTRTTIGATYDAMLVMDVDGNGRLDVIAQSPAGSNIGIYWLTPNASATAFNSLLIGSIPASRDGNSQGYAISQLTVGSRPQLIFSDDTGFYAFTIPVNPLNGNWPQIHVDTTGTQEGVAPVDVDRDGKIDLVGSSHTSAGAQGKEVDWWKNPGTGLGNWSKVVIGPTTYEADRVAVRDINNDGRPDVVVTDSDYNTATGNLSWFEQTAAAGWIKHPIATNVGSLASMDVGDFNQDGLVDIVVGEHQNDHGPLLVTVFQNVGGGASWTPHVISSGRESHEGTQVIDLDNDGDLDVVSIAYNTHQFVHLWRNDAITDSVVDTTPPQITQVASSLVSAMSAQVNWTTNEPADSKVEYGPDSNYGTAVTLIPLATGHTVPLTGLTPNTQYHYRVTSKDASANSATSEDSTFTTLNQDTTPPQITNATVNPLLPTSATINWTTDEPADGQVEYGANSTYGLSTPLQTALVTGHSIAIGGLVSNNTYHFRISTKDSSGNPAQSMDGVFTTPIPDTTLPTVSISAPTGGTVVGTITVTASASDDVGVVGVQFFVDGAALGAETTGPFSTSWNTVLIANGVHALTAVARDAAGNSKTSTPVNVTVSNVILVTHRQGVGVTNDASSSTISLAFASPTLAGDFIVAAVSMGNNVSVTCSDNQSNAYTSLPVQFDGTNNQGLAICYAPNVKAGATTVTVTLGSIASYRRLLIHEYSGLAKTNPVDATVGTIANGTTAANNITTTAGVTTANSSLIFAAVMDDVGTTNIQAGTNFTLRGSVGGADLATEDRVQPAAGSIAGTFTFAGAHRYLARMVAFKAEAAPDTTLPTVSITAPAGSTTVSGNVPLTATATDNVGVVGLQYKVDGANISSEITGANYNLTWDSTTVNNGTRVLTAVACDAAGNTRTSAGVSVTVNNIDSTPPTFQNVLATAVTRTGATITWTTNEPATSQVQYGTDTTYGSLTTLDNTTTLSHGQSLTGLTAGTTYFFRVLSSDASGNPGTSTGSTFTTAPPDTTPPTISGVNAALITTTGATIGWTTDEAATTQVVYGTDTNYGSSTTLDPALTTGHSQALSGLTAGTTYFYRVLSSDADNNPATADASFTTAPPDTTPPTISAVNATNIDKTSGTITWTTNEAATTQVLYGTDTNYAFSTTLNPALTTGHAQALSGLTAGTTYFYRVLSSDADNNPASAESSFTTTPPDTTPPTITGVNATGIGLTSATIGWTTDEAATTQIQYGPDTNYGSSTTLNPALTTGHAQPLTGLTAGTTYFYRVLSSDADSNPASAESSFTTTPPDTTPPTISGVNTTGIGLTSATIAWTTDEAATTQVQYGTDTNYGSSTTLNPALTTGHAQPLSGLAPGTTYFYRVLSSDADNNPASSESSFTTTPPDTTPPTITGVNATGIGLTSATIGWTTDEAATTQIQYGPDTNYAFSTTLNPALTTGHAQALSGLTAGTTYFYRVLSSDADNNPASAESSFTTTPPDTTPPNISGVNATGIGLTSATIGWTTDEAATTQIQYGPDTNYAFSTTLNPALTTGHAQPLSGLTAGTTYFYRVLSSDGAGNPASAESFFTTVAPDTTPPLVSSVLVTGLTSSSATITWQTNEAATSQVTYGLTSTYGAFTTLDPAYLTSHSQTLTSLQAGTTYHFQALSTDAFANTGPSGDLTFTTLAGEAGVPTVGLLGRWKLNEVSGTTAGDSAGSSTGTLANFACTTLNCNATSGWTTPGQFVGAINFDGANDIVTVPQNATLNDLASFTYAAWVLPRSLGEGSAGRIIDKSGTGFKRFRLNNATVSSFYGEVRLGTTNAVATGPANSVTLNQWQHVVMTFDNTTKVLRIYKNGVQIATGTGAGNPQSDATGNVLIGNNAAGGATFNGLIDDVIVYNRTLTSQEVLTLASGAPDLTLPQISGQNATSLTTTAATVVWNTDEASDTSVQYGLDTNYGTTTPVNAALVLAHSVPVSGLTPGTTYQVRVLSRDSSGNLAQSANFSFSTVTPDTTPPTVSISTPAAGNVSGTVNITASASDDVGVASVQYFLDGTTALSGLLSGSPYTFAWSTAAIANGTHTLTAVAKDPTGNATTSAGVSVTVANAPSPIGFVQSASSNANPNATTIVQAFTNPVTAGNLIVAAVSWGKNGSLTCTDSQSNVYTTLPLQYDSTNNQSLGICYAANAKGGATTVTARFGSASDFRRILVHEYQGIAKTSPLDVTAGRIANGTTAANNIASSSVTTTAAGDLVFVAVMDDAGTTTITAGTGYTQRATTASDLASEDRILPTVGAVTGTFTFSTAHRYLICIVTFKAGS